MKYLASLAILPSLLFLGLACGSNVISAEASGTTTGGGAAPATTAGTGAGVASSGSGGATTASAASAGGIGAGATSTSASGTGGGMVSSPPLLMVTVTSPSGVSYRIDNTEVTQASYSLFLASHPQPDPSSSACSWKTTFEPGKEPSQTLGVDGRCAKKQATFFDPPTKGSDPVVCVDWCDAQAYCAWAGKRLCGAIGGGPATTYGDPNESQWYNACSNGGT